MDDTLYSSNPLVLDFRKKRILGKSNLDQILIFLSSEKTKKLNHYL